MTTPCWKLLVTLVAMALLLPLPGRCDMHGCTLNDIQDIQRGFSYPQEKRDGHWYVHKVYGMPKTMFITWYTVDVVPTPTGLALYTNMHAQGGECLHAAVEMTPTSHRHVFTAGEDQDFQTMVVAASDSDQQHALVYLCYSNLTTTATPCLRPQVLLLSRRNDSTVAGQWMTSLTTSSLPCYNDSDSVTVPQVEGCPLKQMIELPGRDCVVANFTVQKDFDLSRYVSSPWKESLWLAPAYLPASEFYRDYIHTYTIEADGNVTCHVSGRTPQNECLSYQVNVTVTSTPGKLIFHDPNKGSIPYDVIHVDYDRFALVFSCFNVSETTGKCLQARGWLWSRDSTLERQYRLQANAMMMDMCVNPAAWFRTEHGDPCPTAVAEGSSGLRISFMLISMLLCAVFITA